MTAPAVLPGPVRERPFARSVTVRTPYRSPLAGLTPREREAASLVCEHGTDETMRRMGIEQRTLRNYLSAVYAAIGIGRGYEGKVGRMCFVLGRYEGRREGSGRA